MRFNEIITEANYRNKIDTSRTYPTQKEFTQALTTKFGAVGPTKDSNPQAGGGIYIISTKGIVGYKVPNTDSPDGFVWYVVKEPFMPASKKKPEAPAVQPVAKPAAKPVVAPKVAPKAAPVDDKATPAQMEQALGQLLHWMSRQKASSMWGNYMTNEPEADGHGGFHAGIRDWGHWQVPDDAEGDPEDFEDYDWEELTPKAGAEVQKIIDRWNKDFDTMKFSWSTGEKNWIELYVTAK